MVTNQFVRLVFFLGKEAARSDGSGIDAGSQLLNAWFHDELSLGRSVALNAETCFKDHGLRTAS